jgi:hypothetical protein
VLFWDPNGRWANFVTPEKVGGAAAGAKAAGEVCAATGPGCGYVLAVASAALVGVAIGTVINEGINRLKPDTSHYIDENVDPRGTQRKVKKIRAERRKKAQEGTESAPSTDTSPAPPQTKERKRDPKKNHAIAGEIEPTQELTGGNWHHMATHYERNGWGPAFESLFLSAGMTVQDDENLIYLMGHKGPHSDEYHAEVFRRLAEALEGVAGVEARGVALRAELYRMHVDILNPLSDLGKLVRKLK